MNYQITRSSLLTSTFFKRRNQVVVNYIPKQFYVTERKSCVAEYVWETLGKNLKLQRCDEEENLPKCEEQKDIKKKDRRMKRICCDKIESKKKPLTIEEQETGKVETSAKSEETTEIESKANESTESIKSTEEPKKSAEESDCIKLLECNIYPRRKLSQKFIEEKCREIFKAGSSERKFKKKRKVCKEERKEPEHSVLCKPSTCIPCIPTKKVLKVKIKPKPKKKVILTVPDLPDKIKCIHEETNRIEKVCEDENINKCKIRSSVTCILPCGHKCQVLQRKPCVEITRDCSVRPIARLPQDCSKFEDAERVRVICKNYYQGACRPKDLPKSSPEFWFTPFLLPLLLTFILIGFLKKILKPSKKCPKKCPPGTMPKQET